MRNALRKRPFSRPAERLVILLLTVCATISIVTTALITFVLVSESITFFGEVSVTRFLDPTGEWQPLFNPVDFSVWELVAGTANTTFWALAMAVPVGLATAVYLSEYAHPNTRKVLKPVLEALAGVPTVVYAYFALTFITQDALQPLFGRDTVPIFNSFAASTMLAVMILPTIASISEDAMTSVPRDLREAAYGLGSTRLEVAFRVVFPAALSGIIASILLSIARAVGETMIVAIAAGSTPNLTMHPFESVQTMTGYMLQVGLGDAARGTVDYQSLFAVGMMLFLITLVFNIAAHLFVRRFQEEYE
ncbi:MAG TPA: phosphate ABC transporter permease subunit PstC [Dehalococcoidia bacterium]|nr:phosphate ABC transporter permease subunit PstC [Dehalococcoidia bacterium]